MPVSKKATKASTKASGKSSNKKKAPATTKAVAPTKAVVPKRVAAPKTVAPKAVASKKAVARRGGGGAGNGHGRASLVDGLARRLDEHRREILHLYKHDLGVGLDAFRDGDDEIDRANFDSDRDLALSLSDTEREVLLQIEEALRRIANGQFGSCTSCSKAIGDQRLNAIPWARYCIDCQELEEKGLLG